MATLSLVKALVAGDEESQWVPLARVRAALVINQVPKVQRVPVGLHVRVVGVLKAPKVVREARAVKVIKVVRVVRQARVGRLTTADKRMNQVGILHQALGLNKVEVVDQQGLVGLVVLVGRVVLRARVAGDLESLVVVAQGRAQVTRVGQVELVLVPTLLMRGAQQALRVMTGSRAAHRRTSQSSALLNRLAVIAEARRG